MSTKEDNYTRLTTMNHYFIVKASGPNLGGPGEKHHFVVDNISYFSFPVACARARELAKASPGNRYYVTSMKAGFMAHEPVLEERSY